MACPRCHGRFALPDSARGRRLKLSCKKCGHVFVVGGASGPAKAPARGSLPSDHVVADGKRERRSRGLMVMLAAVSLGFVGCLGFLGGGWAGWQFYLKDHLANRSDRLVARTYDSNSKRDAPATEPKDPPKPATEAKPPARSAEAQPAKPVAEEVTGTRPVPAGKPESERPAAVVPRFTPPV